MEWFCKYLWDYVDDIDCEYCSKCWNCPCLVEFWENYYEIK